MKKIKIKMNKCVSDLKSNVAINKNRTKNLFVLF